MLTEKGEFASVLSRSKIRTLAYLGLDPRRYLRPTLPSLRHPPFSQGNKIYLTLSCVFKSPSGHHSFLHSAIHDVEGWSIKSSCQH